MLLPKTILQTVTCCQHMIFSSRLVEHTRYRTLSRDTNNSHLKHWGRGQAGGVGKEQSSIWDRIPTPTTPGLTGCKSKACVTWPRHQEVSFWHRRARTAEWSVSWRRKGAEQKPTPKLTTAIFNELWQREGIDNQSVKQEEMTTSLTNQNTPSTHWPWSV